MMSKFLKRKGAKDKETPVDEMKGLNVAAGSSAQQSKKQRMEGDEGTRAPADPAPSSSSSSRPGEVSDIIKDIRDMVQKQEWGKFKTLGKVRLSSGVVEEMLQMIPERADDLFNALRKAEVDSIADLLSSCDWIEQIGDGFTAKGMLASLPSEYLQRLFALRNKVKGSTTSSQPVPLNAILADVLGKIKWPDDVSSFEPKPVLLEDSNPHKSSAMAKGVMGSFLDRTKPEYLLTGLKEPTMATLVALEVDGTSVTSSRLANVSEFENWGCSILVGTSGVGKTRLMYEIAAKHWVALFTASRKGNGGSSELEQILKWAKEQRPSDPSAEGPSAFVIGNSVLRRTRLAVAFRVLLLEVAKEKYGEAFEPMHWAMMQLYPEVILGADPFFDFDFLGQNVEEGEVLRASNSLPRFKFVILDEAQEADKVLPDFFPGTRGVKRSVLRPVVEALAETHKVILCGTGLNVVDVYEVAGSPIKYGVGVRCFGLATLFDAKQVGAQLIKSGVAISASLDTCETFVGRGRHWAYLAQAALYQGKSPDDVCSKVTDAFIEKYKSALSDLTMIPMDQPRRRSPSPAGLKDLRYLLREVALGYMLGGPNVVPPPNIAEALQIGVCAFQRLGNKTELVIAEPLVVRGFGNNPSADFEHFLTGSHAQIGFEFELYLVANQEAFVTLVNASAKEVANKPGGDKFQGTWALGKPDVDGRMAVRAQKDGDEPRILEEIIKRKSWCAVLPGNRMGPDLIFLMWDGEKWILVFVQSKSGGAGTEEARRSLTQPYAGRSKNARGVVPDDLKPASERLKTLLAAPNARLVHVVVKPLTASKSPEIAATRVENGILTVVVDKNSLGKLEALKNGFDSIRRFKQG